jgi:hypothetical protein
VQSPPCPANRARPRVFWYPTPIEPYTRLVSWRTGFLRAAFRRSRYHTERGECADAYLIAHQEGAAGPRSTAHVVRMFEHLARRWPWWNQTRGSRHFLLSPCDHGPKDCLFNGHLYPGPAYQGSRSAGYRIVAGGLDVPMAIAPRGKHRTLGFVQLNGDPAAASFHHGVDVRIPTPEGHACGPFCGMSEATRSNHTEATLLLRELSLWSMTRPAAQAEEMLRSTRPIALFFGGRSAKGGARGALFRAHLNRSDFFLYDRGGRYATPRAAAIASRDANWFPRAMASSTFCFVPLGANEGDSDRYLPAVLLGCIPVFIGEDEPPFADVLPWERFSLRVHPTQVASLHTLLANYTHEQVVAMRLAMRRVWPRLLWTKALRQGLLGRPKASSTGTSIRIDSYLGEDGEVDAFETLVELLRIRTEKSSGPRRLDSDVSINSDETE